MSKFVNDLLRDLKRTSKYLKEDYIFDDMEGQMGPEGMEDEMGGGRRPMHDPTEMQGQQSSNGGDDNAEVQAMHAQEVIKHEPIIAKIRETAIDGLKKYSDNPTSKLYEFFKKVFLESDKVLTDTGSKN